MLPNRVAKIVIAFGKEDPTADLVLTESKYSYQLMVNVLEIRFIRNENGWKGIVPYQNPIFLSALR